MMPPKILVISLGGTITMTREAGAGITPTLSAEELVRDVPGIESVATIEATSLLRMPGASLTLENLLELVARIDAALTSGTAGVVVVQGTATIEETAYVLDILVRSRGAVVVTGAMRGAQAAGADGPANMLAAATVAANPRAVDMGALVVLNDQIHAARHVQKSHTALPSTFVSPSAGPLGLVSEGQARFYSRPSRGPRVTWTVDGADHAVALVGVGLGDDGRVLSALPKLGYRGAVLMAMGAGHVPAAFVPAVKELVGIMPVVLASRVPTGPTFVHTYGFPGSETDLLSVGIISAGGLSAVKARLLLMLLLRQSMERRDIERAFEAQTWP